MIEGTERETAGGDSGTSIPYDVETKGLGYLEVINRVNISSTRIQRDISKEVFSASADNLTILEGNIDKTPWVLDWLRYSISISPVSLPSWEAVDGLSEVEWYCPRISWDLDSHSLILNYLRSL